MNNAIIRNEIKQAGFKHWNIAEVLQITETNFSKWFRHELTDERKQQITNAINQLKGEKANV